MAEDLGQLRALRYLKVDVRFYILLLLLPSRLSFDILGRTVVEVVFTIVLHDVLHTLRFLASDLFSKISNLLLVSLASDAVLVFLKTLSALL